MVKSTLPLKMRSAKRKQLRLTHIHFRVMFLKGQYASIYDRNSYSLYLTISTEKCLYFKPNITTNFCSVAPQFIRSDHCPPAGASVPHSKEKKGNKKLQFLTNILLLLISCYMYFILIGKVFF